MSLLTYKALYIDLYEHSFYNGSHILVLQALLVLLGSWGSIVGIATGYERDG
jgi:hypothetical protein